MGALSTAPVAVSCVAKAMQIREEIVRADTVRLLLIELGRL
ncbi:hypothetical protein [Halorubrum sp. LN27]|nr:hypothetical protein [Halorubrum sp. LN27]